MSVHWLVAEIFARGFDVEVAIDQEHANAEWRELELFPEHVADAVADVRQRHHKRPSGQTELFLQRRISEIDECAIDHVPQLHRLAIGADVKVSERRRVLVQRALAQNQPVAIVIHVTNATFVLPVAKNAQFLTRH